MRERERETRRGSRKDKEIDKEREEKMAYISCNASFRCTHTLTRVPRSPSAAASWARMRLCFEMAGTPCSILC